MTDLSGSVRLSTSYTDENVTRVGDLLNSDRVKMIAHIRNFQIATLQIFMTNDLNIRKMFAKLVTYMLTDKQKPSRLIIVNEIQIVPVFVAMLLSRNETWALEYD